MSINRCRIPHIRIFIYGTVFPFYCLKYLSLVCYCHIYDSMSLSVHVRSLGQRLCLEKLESFFDEWRLTGESLETLESHCLQFELLVVRRRNYLLAPECRFLLVVRCL